MEPKSKMNAPVCNRQEWEMPQNTHINGDLRGDVITFCQSTEGTRIIDEVLIDTNLDRSLLDHLNRSFQADHFDLERFWFDQHSIHNGINISVSPYLGVPYAELFDVAHKYYIGDLISISGQDAPQRIVGFGFDFSSIGILQNTFAYYAPTEQQGDRKVETYPSLPLTEVNLVRGREHLSHIAESVAEKVRKSFPNEVEHLKHAAINDLRPPYQYQVMEKKGAMENLIRDEAKAIISDTFGQQQVIKMVISLVGLEYSHCSCGGGALQ